jgi:tRNA modification GTPase
LATADSDTIAAIATARGNAGIGIIRISGSETGNLLRQLYPEKLQPRKATLAKLYDHNRELLDQVLLLHFPAPGSFTGEDLLEIHCHGGTVVLDMVLEHVLSLGCRQARPGEFSERAFLNGKIDLAQAEAIADLIESQSRSAARGAIRSLQGDFSREVHQLVDSLIHLRMLAEAYMDFPDEEIEEIPVAEFEQQLAAINSGIDDLLEQAVKGSLLRDGFHIVLAGRPNAGKSSLLNLLTRRDTAIVSEQAGTTRDIIRDRIDLDGLVLDVTDTAGLRETTDQVESEGVRRAQKELESADRILLVIDDTDNSKEVRTELSRFMDHDVPVTVIRNKIDKTGNDPGIDTEGKNCEIHLSVKSGAGVDLLYQHLKEISSAESMSEGVFIARRRHIEALEKARKALLAANTYTGENMQLELLAEDCRLAQQNLNEITGEFGSEDLLGRIFSSFCIGK